MRVVIQRVSQASVTIAGKRKSEIGHGMMILVGFEATDDEKEEDIPALAVAAFNDVCTGGNPRPTSVEDIEALYHKAF